MNDRPRKRWFDTLRRPSASLSVLTLLVAGILLGVAGVIAFDATMHATGTEQFCTSCHEMGRPYAQLKTTPHFSNRTGVAATCIDCHLPQEFIPKMVRKIEASREVWGHMTGLLDTPEKYAAHLPAMKEREINRLKANGSQECRNCHTLERMNPALQSKMAARSHKPERMQDKSCIDCHAGIAHSG